MTKEEKDRLLNVYKLLLPEIKSHDYKASIYFTQVLIEDLYSRGLCAYEDMDLAYDHFTNNVPADNHDVIKSFVLEQIEKLKK